MLRHRKPLVLLVAGLALAGLGLARFHGFGSSPIGDTVPAQPTVTTERAASAPKFERHPRAAAKTPGVAAGATAGLLDPTKVGPNAVWTQFKPERVSLPVAGIPVTFVVRSIQTQPDGRVMWNGSGEGTPELTLVSVASPNCYDAIVFAPDCNETHYAIRAGKTTVREIDPDTEEVCPQALIPGAEATRALPSGAGIVQGDVYIADVLYVYTADRVTKYGSVESAYNDFSVRLAAANQMLVDSGVDNLQLRAVGSMQFDYTSDGKLETALNAVTNSATVRAKRQELYADLVVFEVGEPQDYAGLAWMPTTPSLTSSYATVLGAGASTMLHEIAHNFGCNHDRKTAGAADSDTNYNYGHRFTYNNTDTGTIMSYAGYRLSMFSNPSLSFNGNALGIAAGQLGAADNARVLRENASIVAGLYSDPNTVLPTITRQPTGASLTVGASLQLSVTASGGTLFYQWFKDSTAISGATASSYSVATATAADAGTYAVSVRNATGTVTSNSVIVSVTPATNPTTPSDSGSGGSSRGGGGGGAVSPVFLALFALLGWMRFGRSLLNDGR